MIQRVVKTNLTQFRSLLMKAHNRGENDLWDILK